MVAWVAVAALVVAFGAAGWLVGRSGGTPDPTDPARVVAEEFGAAYLTFDASSVDFAGDQLLALTTDRFAAEFRDDRLPAVAQLFADSSTSTRATVTDSFASRIDTGRVRIVVLVDVDATAAEGAQRLSNLSFVVEVVEQGGAWKVDGVSPLPAPEVIDPEAPAAGSTTTAPVPPATSTPDTPTSG
jgi:hypothetical protein